MAAKDDGDKIDGRRRPANRGSRVAGCLQRNKRKNMESDLERSKKGSKRQEQSGKGETRTCWTCGRRTRHIAVWCRKIGNNGLYAIDQDDSEYVEEAPDTDLQA